MIRDVRLYTWVDVEEVLLQAQQENDWPEWLIWARAYWDGVTLGIRPNRRSEALTWLSERFDPRFAAENGQAFVLLESVQDAPRQLNIFLEETTESPLQPPFLPRLKLPSVLWPPYKPTLPTAMPEELPPVVAFHSFKGGVGRTLHALALAQALAQEGGRKSRRILLVDGDLEAPGLTWLLRDRFPNPSISLVDFLALVHSDPDPTAQNSIELVANQVRDLFLDEIYVLPAFRSTTQFTYLEVKPEHIIQGAEDQFILTTILAKLGKLLNVRAVIVDLRAGFSEFAAGLLLDPRVYRVLVTTLSAQSIEGTQQVLQFLGRMTPTKPEEAAPALIISQVPSDYQRLPALLSSYEKQLLEAAEPFLTGEQDEVTTGLPRVISYFDQSLAVLPHSWEAVTKLSGQRELVEKMRSLADWLPGAPPEDTSQEAQIGREELKRRRIELTNFAKSLVYAETGDIGEFLSILPIHNLASDFSAKAPIAIVIGAKGAGKTYMFLQIVRRENWQTFIKDAGVMDTAIEAHACPILSSMNLKETANAIVQQSRQKTSESLTGSSPRNSQEISDYLRESLREKLHEGQWRERWLNVIAWSMGFEVGKDNAGRNLAPYLRQRNQFVVAIFDGLEDLFQDLPADENQQIAFRALLQEVPQWLEQQPSRPIGLLVFVRQDMVLNAIKQNAAQLMARYDPYALKWNPEQALRLVAWIVSKAPLDSEIEALHDLRESELVDELEFLWGRKLGSERSREARSAEWVIAALSDFMGQIQARDLVRFLSNAAEESQTNTFWRERLLVPPAVRKAIKVCSQEKIDEIGIENSRLGHILNKLEKLQDKDKWVPFTQEQVNLDADELKTLEVNGVVLREGEEYYMPEIFRLGLDFKLVSGARPRVLTLSRQTRR